MSGESAMEIDYQTCKRLGASYCALPKDTRQVCTELQQKLVELEIEEEEESTDTALALRKSQWEESIVKDFISRAGQSRAADAELSDNKENVQPRIGKGKEGRVIDCDMERSKRLIEILLITGIELPEDLEHVLSELERGLPNTERKWQRKVRQVSLGQSSPQLRKA